jgi:hypothetical protein
MKLSDLVDAFIASRVTGGLVLDPTEVQAQGVRAAVFYAGFGDFKTPPPSWNDTDKPIEAIDGDLDLTRGEWAICSPLFRAYTDYENALRIEASVGMGVQGFGGPSSSEMAQQIAVLEDALPHKAFSEDVQSDGIPDDIDEPQYWFPYPYPYPYFS